MFEELFEELEDFIEDIIESFTRKKFKRKRKKRTAFIRGVEVKVRPAVIFAERLEGLLKIIFGVSIIVSAIVAFFWGLTGTSDLLRLLIKTFWGRLFMIFVGGSYALIGLWKLAKLKK